MDLFTKKPVVKKETFTIAAARPSKSRESQKSFETFETAQVK